MRLTLPAVLTILGMLGSAGGVWVATAGDIREAQTKVSAIEKRQSEDRRDTRESINEVKDHVKLIDQNVQVILQTVKSMEAVQRAERRGRQ